MKKIKDDIGEATLPLSKLPKNIKISLVFLLFPLALSLISFFVLCGTLISGYNKLNSTGIILITALLTVFFTHYILIKEIQKKNKKALSFISTYGFITAILYAVEIWFLLGRGVNPHAYLAELRWNVSSGILRIVGLVIFSFLVLSPTFSAFYCGIQKDYFNKRKSVDEFLTFSILGFIIGLINSLTLSIFSYLFLVTVLPYIFGLNT